MKRQFLSAAFGAGLVVLLAGCGHLVYADGPYPGTVIDKETRQPIEGAAVLAVWWKRSPGIAHPIISFYDAQETLTDQGGNFTIPGILGGSPNPLTMIHEPLFTIFKPGYEAYGDWKLKPPSQEGRTVVELRRLTAREERLRNLDRIFISSHVPREKYPELLRLKKAEQANLGLR